MRRFLLDTNAISDLMNDPLGRVATEVRRVGSEAIVTSIVVVAELRFGAAKRGSQSLSRRIEEALRRMTVLPFEAPGDAIYARIRADLERRGTPIGANDLLIAATALAADATLVTHNTREFARVDGLRVQDWLA